MSPLIKEPFAYQKTPSFRVQVPNNKAVSLWHTDSDEQHLHPVGELNFILPAILKYHFIAFPTGEMTFGLFTNANEAIIAIDNNGIILRTNDKANELFNLSTKNLQKDNIVNHLKDYSLEGSRENIEKEL